MLDHWAIAILARSDAEFSLMTIAAVTAGFFPGAWVNYRRQSWLGRLPYFTASALLYFTGSILSYTWVLAAQAYERGLLFVLVASYFLAFAALGYVYGKMSVARSRDAFGHSGRYFLALIPPVNLVLLFGERKESEEPEPAFDLVHFYVNVFLGTAAGLWMLVAGTILFMNADIPSNYGDSALDSADRED